MLKLLTLYVWVSHRCYNRRMNNTCRRREHERVHCFHWVFDNDSRMALLNLVLSVAVHADDAIVDWTLCFRDNRRLINDIEIFLFYQRRGWNPWLLNILHHWGLLLNWGKKTLLLLLLRFRIRYMMSHLKLTSLSREWTSVNWKSHLFMPIDIVRVSTSFALAINTRLRVNVARTSLTATGQFSRCRRCIPASASSTFLRIIGIRCQWHCWRRWNHVSGRRDWLRRMTVRCGDLYGRPHEIRIHHGFSLQNGHLKENNPVNSLPTGGSRKVKKLTLLFVFKGRTLSSGGFRFRVILLPLPV